MRLAREDWRSARRKKRRTHTFRIKQKRYAELSILTTWLILMGGCGVNDGIVGGASYEWFGTQVAQKQSGPGLSVRWRRTLTRHSKGSYLPVEHATALIDPIRNQVFVGSSSGAFRAFNSNGRLLWEHPMGSSVEAAPGYDPSTRDVFVASEDGVVHRIDGSNGAVAWSKPSGSPIRNTPRLNEDAVYVASVNDGVTALSREDGESLWTYLREPNENLSITGRAGIALTGRWVLSAFSDGMVVALDRSDGSLVWERDTSIDVRGDEGDPDRFFDVDTTPLIDGDVVYVGAYGSGLYALQLANGSVIWRDAELLEIVGLALFERYLVVASSSEGIVCIDTETRQRRWQQPVERGAPSVPVIAGGAVWFGESQGSFRMLDLDRGQELGRIDAGTGFSASAAIALPFGIVLSNGGSLLAFRISSQASRFD
ncbi:MAG: PQQ-binding-like beta-propeller repeat protein [Myxococcota bacterium]